MTILNNKGFKVGTTIFLSEVLKWAEESGEPYGSICELKKVPARLGLCDQDLASISADLQYFEIKIATSPYGTVSKSKDLEVLRKRANSRLRSLLKRFHADHGNMPKQVGREEWTQLIMAVRALEGFADRGAVFTTGQSRTLTSLRARASVAPVDLCQGEVDRIVKVAKSEKRRAITKGVRFLNRLITEFGDHPAFVELIPRKPFIVPAGSDRAKRILWSSLPQELRVSVETVMDAMLATPETISAAHIARIHAGEDKDQVRKELTLLMADKRVVPQNAEAAMAGYKSAVTWLVRAAEELGMDRNQFADLESLMSLEIMRAACDQQIERSRNSSTLKDANKTQSLMSRLTALRTLATHGLKNEDLILNINLLRGQHGQGDNERKRRRSEHADEVCRVIQRHPHLAANFVNAPQTIADIAEKRITAAREQGNDEAEQRALRLYATAVAFAVQVSRPIRTSNLIRLRHRASEDLLGNVEWLDNRKHARLTFKENEVKNSKVIVVHLLGAEALILEKWLSKYRLRYCELRGIADSVYVLPGDAKPRLGKGNISLPRGCVSPSTMSELWDDGAKIIGLNLTPHESRHVVATLILAIEPGNFSKVASVLGDTTETVMSHYGRDSGEQAACDVLKAIKAQHPGVLNRMKNRENRK